MNCPSCGAPMQLKPDAVSFRCDFCHNVCLPEKGDDGVRVLGEASTDICPHCNVALVHATIADVRMLYCTQCRGMLIPMGAFSSLVEELRSVGSGSTVQPGGDSSDLRQKIACPHCRKSMDMHFYAGPGNVVIDSCEDCSLNWLDRGALMHIVQAPDGAGQAQFDSSSPADDESAEYSRWL